ncbi:MAG: AMP-binding protein, partial [bacterium]
MYNTDIFQAFKSRAEQRGDKSALIFGTHEISYRRLLDAVERLAHSMKNLGVSQGDPFAIMLPNVPQLIISYFALLKLGATVVLVKTDY